MGIEKTTQALLYLMRCALHNQVPEPIPGLDYEALYKLSVSHSVVAMLAMALESGKLFEEQYVTDECRKKWNDARVKAVRKNILFDEERAQIFQKFEADGVWYLPLKGIVLKDMYPKMGMRQMSDNDILFDPTYQQRLKEYMESRGYQAVAFNTGNHDAYEKMPVYRFEFHTVLFNAYSFPEWVAYYEEIKQRLVKDPENEYGYHFSDEDFYIYLLLHGYKHFSNYGNGIRFLVDIFVFLQKKKQQLDQTYVSEELKKLGIDEFESMISKLAVKLFQEEQPEALTEEEQSVLSKLIGSGTYGTVDNHVEGELRKLQKDIEPITVLTRVRYIVRRLFPDREFMKEYSAFCRKHPWSIPFVRIYRIVSAFVLRRKYIGQEIKAIKKERKKR